MVATYPGRAEVAFAEAAGPGQDGAMDDAAADDEADTVGALRAEVARLKAEVARLREELRLARRDRHEAPPHYL